MRSELPALTGLRFFAAFFVMLAHISAQSGPIPASVYIAGLTTSATIGMVLFFTLSGFVLQYNYGSAIASGGRLVNGKEVKRFAISRIARIYPLYLAFLFLMIGWQHLVKWQTTGGIISVLLHLFSLQSLFFLDLGGSRMYPYYGVTWSISTEMFFYMMFPLLTVAVTRWLNSAAKAAVAVGVLSALLLYYAAALRYGLINLASMPSFHHIFTWGYDFDQIGSLNFPGWLANISPYSRMIEFLTGMLTAQLFVQVQNKPLHNLEQAGGAVLTWAAVMASMAMLFAVYEPHRNLFWGPGQPHFILAPFVAMVIFTVVRYPSLVSRFLSKRLLVRLGDISYSIYLLHVLVTSALAGVFAKFDSSTGTAFFLRIAIIAVGTMVVSFLVYEYFESPARWWIRQKLSTDKIRRVKENPVET